MGIYTLDELRQLGKSRASRTYKSSAAILNEVTESVSKGAAFDVFLSHSVLDAEVILGILDALEQQGLSVYVDWVNDPQMSREHVTPSTAEKLRSRMRQSKALIYAHSDNATQSKWMPWELGCFDGANKPIAILPISNKAVEGFSGQEFLGIYPYLDHTAGTTWINAGRLPQTAIGSLDKSFRPLKEWVGRPGLR